MNFPHCFNFTFDQHIQFLKNKSASVCFGILVESFHNFGVIRNADNREFAHPKGEYIPVLATPAEKALLRQFALKAVHIANQGKWGWAFKIQGILLKILF